jgi:magnesium transporter
MEVLDRLDVDRITALRARGEFFWLDLQDPPPADLDALGAALGLPAMALQDSKELHQRPKIDAYRNRVLIVFYGVASTGTPFEVHLHVSGSELVTVREAPCAELDAVKVDAASAPAEQEVVARVLGALAASVRAVVDDTTAHIDELEEESFEHPSRMDRIEISRLRRTLFRLGQIVVPERDMLASDAEVLEQLPGLEREEARHPFRDVHDELVLTANAIAFGRERLSEALNVYLSSVSNRLNELAARLTLVATIFLPLSFVTGFFGQNFGWLVRHIDTFGDFVAFGIGGSALPIAVVLTLLWRRGYFRSAQQ